MRRARVDCAHAHVTARTVRGSVTHTLRFLAQTSLLLLLALVGVILAYPFLETSDAGRAGLNAINPVLVILALRVIGHTPTLRRVDMLLAVAPVLLHGYYASSGGASYGLAQNNADARVTWWDLLYFSFTTLTSVG